MTSIVRTALFIATVLIGLGCEKELTDSDLPYEEKIVVHCILHPNDVIDSLYIGRTIPVLTNDWSYNHPFDTVATKNALVTVTVDGVSYPLTYHRYGYFKNDTLVARSGKTYSLTVQWNGKIAQSMTTVPLPPKVDSIVLESIKDYSPVPGGPFSEKQYTFKEYISSPGNVVLSIVREKSYGSYGYSTSWDVVSGSSVQGNNQWRVTSHVSKYVNDTWNNSLNYIFRTYDVPYYSYYITAGNHSDDMFVSSSPVAWNVYKGGIGMFIGASEKIFAAAPLP